MDYLVVYLNGRSPEHLITDEEDQDSEAIIRKYWTWVEARICRVFRTTQDNLDLTYHELQRDGKFLECPKEFM